MTVRGVMEWLLPKRSLPDPSAKLDEALDAQAQAEASAQDLQRTAAHELNGIEAATSRIQERLQYKRPIDPRIKLALEVLKVVQARA